MERVQALDDHVDQSRAELLPKDSPRQLASVHPTNILLRIRWQALYVVLISRTPGRRLTSLPGQCRHDSFYIYIC